MHHAQVNRVLDFIEEHLSESLSVARLAKVAHASKFHFHRVFHRTVGESPHGYVRRIRVERAASMLLHSPLSITEIAHACGFSSSATFAKAFRALLGMTATAWREGGHRTKGDVERKKRQTLRTERKAYRISARYFDRVQPTWRYTMTTKPLTGTIEVQQRPPLEVAYVRHVGPYAGNSALFQKLFGQIAAWAGARNLLGPDAQFLTIAHDDPAVTDESKRRISVCVTVPDTTEASGEIGRMTVTGGTYAVGHFEVDVDRVADAWDAVIAHWLPESGYQPDARHCYEVSLNDPREHPEGKLILDICVPVRPG
ncbi:MAG: GyrI-like domain-containing protein [Myxococcota bacterium]